LLDHAVFYRDNVAAATKDLRDIVDTLETIIPDDLWPLPTYQEMLFIK
jgi:glutamine synthetase